VTEKEIERRKSGEKEGVWGGRGGKEVSRRLSPSPLHPLLLFPPTKVGRKKKHGRPLPSISMLYFSAECEKWKGGKKKEDRPHLRISGSPEEGKGKKKE